MKRAVYYIVPVVLIIVAARFFRSAPMADGPCNLSATEYKAADKANSVILDVRTQQEFDYGHLEGAVLLDIYQKSFRDEVNKLDKDTKYFVYCKAGIRSKNAVNFMLQSGFTEVCNLNGGINQLSGSGVALVK
jgi:phage shock protein E